MKRPVLLLAIVAALGILFTDEESLGALMCLAAVGLVAGWLFAAVVTVAFELVMLIGVIGATIFVAAAFGGVKPSYRW